MTTQNARFELMRTTVDLAATDSDAILKHMGISKEAYSVVAMNAVLSNPENSGL